MRLFPHDEADEVEEHGTKLPPVPGDPGSLVAVVAVGDDMGHLVDDDQLIPRPERDRDLPSAVGAGVSPASTMMDCNRSRGVRISAGNCLALKLLLDEALDVLNFAQRFTKVMNPALRLVHAQTLAVSRVSHLYLHVKQHKGARLPPPLSYSTLWKKLQVACSAVVSYSSGIAIGS